MFQLKLKLNLGAQRSMPKKPWRGNAMASKKKKKKKLKNKKTERENKSKKRFFANRTNGKATETEVDRERAWATGVKFQLKGAHTRPQILWEGAAGVDKDKVKAKGKSDARTGNSYAEMLPILGAAVASVRIQWICPSVWSLHTLQAVRIEFWAWLYLDTHTYNW